MFESLIKLHYSQTGLMCTNLNAPFESLIKLHYSQTTQSNFTLNLKFESLIKLHYSQTYGTSSELGLRFASQNITRIFLAVSTSKRQPVSETAGFSMSNMAISSRKTRLVSSARTTIKPIL